MHILLQQNSSVMSSQTSLPSDVHTTMIACPLPGKEHIKLLVALPARIRWGCLRRLAAEQRHTSTVVRHWAMLEATVVGGKEVLNE